MLDSLLWAVGWVSAVAALAACFSGPRPEIEPKPATGNVQVGWEALHSVPSDALR